MKFGSYVSLKDSAPNILNYLKVFRSYLGFRMYYVFMLTILGGLMESIGIMMFLPLLQSINSVGKPMEDGMDGDNYTLLSNFPLDSFAIFSHENSVVFILLAIATAFILKAVVAFASLAYSAYLRGELLKMLKNRMYDSYGLMKYEYYITQDSGKFINIVNEQITRTLLSFQHLTLMITQIVTGFIYLFLGLLLSWKFGLMSILVGIIILNLFRWLNKYVRAISRDTAKENSILSGLLIQALHAFKYLKATGQYKCLKTGVTNSISNLTKFQVKTGISVGFTQAIREPVAVVLVMSIVIVQLVFFEEPLAPILVSILLFHRGLNIILGIQYNWQQTLEYIGSMEMVHEEFSRQELHRESINGLALDALNYDIEFQEVSFSYGDRSNLHPIIKNVNLKFSALTSVALIGSSGAGKSTVVDLITLMLNQQEGEILIGGLSSKSINLNSWRQKIGYVSQEAVIFDDSIANNICMWEGDSVGDNILMDRISHAAESAYISEFIDTLPDGYQTMVGDRGVRLSGGQKQRIFIARELFRKPSLLILDEATSALDTKSEAQIQKSIDNLKGSMTIIIIAHRLSTIRNVDYVYVLNLGEVVEHGSYQSLRNSNTSQLNKLIKHQAL